MSIVYNEFLARRDCVKYFKNSDLIKLYRISDKSIRNWIEAAKTGRNNLVLYYDEKDKAFIADTLDNIPIIEELVAHGRKYRNERSLKVIRPLSSFYELYNPSQVTHIINSLEIHREYPLRYRYFGKGALYWDLYLQKLNNSGSSNLLKTSIELLEEDWPQLERSLKNYKFINVVDLGVGNGIAIRKALEHLQKTKKLKRYIGLDLSEKLLDITETNIRDWFNDKITMERYVRDISSEHFSDITSTDSFGHDANSTVNLIFFLGGTIMNFKEPDQVLRVIRDSMAQNDVLITSLKLDSLRARRFFDFNIRTDKTVLPSHHGFMLDLLSIDKSLYEIEQFYDHDQRARFIQIRLKMTISIHFKLKDFIKIVELQKGDTILLARILHWSTNEMINLQENNSLELCRATISCDSEYLLTVSKVRKTAPNP